MDTSLNVTLKKIKDFLKKGSSSVIHHRGRDWKLLITFLITISLAAVGLDGYLFFELRSNLAESTSVAVATRKIVLDDTKLDETLSTFQEKALQLEKYKKEVPKVADPSL